MSKKLNDGCGQNPPQTEKPPLAPAHDMVGAEGHCFDAEQPPVCEADFFGSVLAPEDQGRSETDQDHSGCGG